MNATSAITAAHEEFVRDLMRGEKVTFQRGYTHENAAYAAQDKYGLDDATTELLSIHGLGFRDGTRRMTDTKAAVTVTGEFDWTDEQSQAYDRGLTRGLTQDDPGSTNLA